MLQKAISLHRVGRIPEAAVLYRRIVAQNPRDANALNLLGLVELQQGRPAEAVGWIDRALTIDPVNASFHCNRGVALQDLRRFGEAIASYDRALAIRNDLPEALNNRGVALREMKRFAEALASYDSALTVRPHYAEAHNNRGNVLRNLQRRDEGCTAYLRALAIKPDYADACRNLAELLQELGRLEPALGGFDRLLKMTPRDASAQRSRGLLLQQLKRHEDAIESYGKAIAIDPDDAQAHNGLGNVLAELQKIDAAVAQYRKAISIRPLYFEAHLNLANLFAGRRRFAEAAEHYRKASIIMPQCAEAHIHLGEMLLELRRVDEAIEAAEAATRIADGESFPHFSLGVLLARCGRRDSAREQILQHLKRQPEDGEGARMVLAGLGFGPLPERASELHLRRIYRARAQHWTGTKGYRGHELVTEAVMRFCRGETALDVLDAGCGSGLLGERLRDFARRLDGVDISAAMLAKAMADRIYDFLYETDLVAFMAAHPDSYDVIASAATLIHFGALTPVFVAAAQALHANGLFVFTVFPNEEEQENAGVAVAPLGGLAEGGCFVHGREYIRRAAAATGFDVVLMETGVHECDNNGGPVSGLTVAMRRAINGR